MQWVSLIFADQFFKTGDMVNLSNCYLGIYDQSAPADMLLSQPALYAVGRESQLYRSHSFWVNIIDALYQSTVIFFIAYCVIKKYLTIYH